MAFSPEKVVSMLLSEFVQSQNSRAATRAEMKIVEKLPFILRECLLAGFDVETDEDLDKEVPSHEGWDYDDEDGHVSGTQSDADDVVDCRGSVGFVISTT